MIGCGVRVRYLFLLFVVVPLVELYLLLWLTRQTSFLTTVAVTVLTGALGSALAKQQGLKAYREWKRSLDAALAPEIGLVEGLLILVGGVLLITPGLLTDACGFLLLVPATRRRVARALKDAISRRIAQGTLVVQSSFSTRQHGTPRDVIDVRGDDVAEEAAKERTRSE
jgi:UPF0716 protein FxsA